MTNSKPMLTQLVVCLPCITGISADIRSECLRKLSSQTPMFALGTDVIREFGLGLNPASDACFESNSQLFGIHPFYIPRG